jgi:CBS domain-containing protein
MAIQSMFPGAGVVLPLAALIGMSAMFAGASRALLTSIIFALETTGQSNALLPLLAGCVASYVISFFIMENTIMTEKIARRGVKTPHSYEPDILEKILVQQVTKGEGTVLSQDATIEEVREWLMKTKDQHNYYIVVNKEGVFMGIVSSSNIFSMHHQVSATIGSLIKRKPVAITKDDSLKTAVETMAKANLDVLPVISSKDNKITGFLSYKDILAAYRHRIDEHEEGVAISLKRRTLKMLVHGKKRLSVLNDKK